MDDFYTMKDPFTQEGNCLVVALILDSIQTL